jgi:hypothetical protein
MPADQIDKSWWQDQPCRTPCWYGLKIGETSLDDARKVIPQLTFIDPASEKISNVGYYDYSKDVNFGANLVTYKYKQPNNLICVALTFVDDKLVRINFGPNYQFALQDLVDKIGPPDYVGARAITPEITDCEIILTWLDRQISVSYYERQKNSGRDLCKIVRDAGMKPLGELQIQNVYIEFPEQLQGEIQGNNDQHWNGFQN